MQRPILTAVVLVCVSALPVKAVYYESDQWEKCMVNDTDRGIKEKNCALFQKGMNCRMQFIATFKRDIAAGKYPRPEKARQALQEIEQSVEHFEKAGSAFNCSAAGETTISAANQAETWCYENSTDDQTIAGCTQVIQSGRASQRNLVNAYNNRCVAYEDKGDLDRAIADCTQAIQLDPKYANAYNNRGSAYRRKGDFDRAIADYNQAIQLNPKLVRAYTNRGLANLFAGALPKALADLNQASELDPKDAYAALFLDIANRRSNLPSRLPEAIKQIDMTKWPAPVIRLYLGQLTPEAVLAAADDPDATTKKDQVCEANFYSGELALQRSAKDEATRLFQLAVTGCSIAVYAAGANVELKALGASPQRTEQ